MTGTGVLPLSALGATGVGSIILLALGHYRGPDEHVSNDGDRYLRMGSGQAVAYPFMWRWVVPALCGASLRRWRICTTVHLLALPVLTTAYISQWPIRASAAVVGGLLICGFPGLWWNHFRRPVLVDPTAIAWTVLASILSLNGWWPAALVVVLVAACMKETAPVFAACFSLNPLLLLGLVAPLIRRLTAPGAEEPDAEELSDPIGSARRAHAAHIFDPVVMIAPWGVGVLAVLARDRTIVTVLALAAFLAYAQLSVAVNRVRLYQWAGPAVALATASVLPAGWEPAALLVHLFNPLAGNGR